MVKGGGTSGTTIHGEPAFGKVIGYTFEYKGYKGGGATFENQMLYDRNQVTRV